MNIIATSDLHIDQHDRQAALDKLVTQDADVLIIGGDIAQTKNSLQKALRKLSEFGGIKLAYLGNHELRCTDQPLGSHHEEMTALYRQHGFHLLDEKPFVHNNIGFVGNSGWFDFTLYKGTPSTTDLKRAQDYHYGRHCTNSTPLAFTQTCVERIRTHLASIEDKCSAIVLGIHHITFPNFLIYGASPEYDYKNLFMGSTLFKEFYKHPKVKIGLCGHTHRPGYIHHDGRQIHNVSWKPDKPYWAFTL